MRYEGDRDALRFLWAADPYTEPPEVITLRFARVVSRISSSPFLLNAKTKHHIETYCSIDPSFVSKFLASVYMDDLVTGSADVRSAFEFYKKSRQRLAVAGLQLRKFVTNSERSSSISFSRTRPSMKTGERNDYHLIKILEMG